MYNVFFGFPYDQHFAFPDRDMPLLPGEMVAYAEGESPREYPVFQRIVKAADRDAGAVGKGKNGHDAPGLPRKVQAVVGAKKGYAGISPDKAPGAAERPDKGKKLDIGECMGDTAAAQGSVDDKRRVPAPKALPDTENGVGIVLFHRKAKRFRIGIGLWHGVKITDEQIRLLPRSFKGKEACVGGAEEIPRPYGDRKVVIRDASGRNDVEYTFDHI